MHYILMCRSLTSAQKAARMLQNAGIFASVTKAPQSANPSGCTYGVKVAARHITRALEIVRGSGTAVKKVFQTDGETLAEVQL